MIITDKTIKVGSCLLDPLTGLYKWEKSSLEFHKLGGRELRLFLLLHKNLGELVTKRTLLDVVWEGRVIGESSLNVSIFKLRAFLKEVSAEFAIINVSRIGYVMQKTP
ncbi:helix-turn-helix domain-containing protein [Vibrio sp. D420a]|uniref:winged helix-turn-helix domain-containing protein n=1 Tax=Vibrio sp. D420a TaxID=2836895 RepID=UPI0025548A98|nr:helix-turn-helix domain-containing protein [Vibrio sp. D420a]MDK9764715.1 helix-turn-helix domain-containing protein [Vibrio sp. D420a]